MSTHTEKTPICNEPTCSRFGMPFSTLRYRVGAINKTMSCGGDIVSGTRREALITLLEVALDSVHSNDQVTSNRYIKRASNLSDLILMWDAENSIVNKG